jgi:TDG/mug DNA glycosylase family protein
MTGRRQLAWGAQATRFADAAAWVLPNPSGLNRGFGLDALVTAYRELRLALETGSAAALEQREEGGRDQQDRR